MPGRRIKPKHPARASLAADLKSTQVRPVAPSTFKVTLDGIDLQESSGALRTAHGLLIQTLPPDIEILGRGLPQNMIKVRFWLHQDKTDDLVAELLAGRHPEVEIGIDAITAVG